MDKIVYTKSWRRLNKPELTIFNSLSESIARWQIIDRQLLPDLSSAASILVASDYSGEHASASYRCYSFLFANLDQSTAWEIVRKKIRSELLPNGRRMAYKKLNDKYCQQALSPLLAAANNIYGLSVTILISKQLDRCFFNDTDINSSTLSFWTPVNREKLLTITHLISLFLQGLSTPNQDVLWITDEDDIAANDAKLKRLADVFSNVCSYYLTHSSTLR